MSATLPTSGGNAGTGAIDESKLEVHQRDRHGLPLNAEIKEGEVSRQFITPTNAIFHRNHDDIVEVPQDVKAVEEEWKLAISIDENVRQGAGDDVRWPEDESRSVTYGYLLRDQNVQRIGATATLECAGNRREDLAQQGEKAEGIQWGAGAISTAKWYGPAIRSLLLQQGLPDPYAHHDENRRCQLEPSSDAIQRDCAPWARSLHLHMLSAQPTSESDKPGTGEFFGASVPLSTAMHPQQQCIVATHHNASILTQSHGFPLRIVIPGHVGARWVKWLRGLHVSTRPEQSPPMRLDYKLLTPPKGASEAQLDEWKESMMGEQKDVDARKAALNEEEPMQALGVGSHIQEPVEEASLKRGAKINASGYAVGQNGSPVTLVEVILLAQEQDDESTPALRRRAAQEPASRWLQATIETEKESHDEKDQPDSTQASFAWSLWQCEVPTDKCSSDGASHYALVARATTASGVQQEQESPWNIRGFATRSWPVVRKLKFR